MINAREFCLFVYFIRFFLITGVRSNRSKPGEGSGSA